MENSHDALLIGAIEKNLAAAKLTAGLPLIVAFSGGPDSLALLHVLRKVVSPQELIVAHLNHGLRPAADEDARKVKEMASQWGLVAEIGQADVPGKARRHSLSLEDAGRKARYAFLAAIASQYHAEAVVTGHNADDQAETVLMHLLRGSGLDGLAGMKVVGVVPDHEELSLLRPMLTIYRTDIENYCQVNGLQPLEDESNRDLSFTRNRIRHQLLPILSQYNEQAKQHLVQLATLVRGDRELLNQATEEALNKVVVDQGENWLRFDHGAWMQLPTGQKRRSLRTAIQRLAQLPVEITMQSVEDALELARSGHSGSRLDLPGSVLMLLEHRHILLATNLDEIKGHWPQLFKTQSAALEVPGSVTLEQGWRLSARESNSQFADIVANSDPWRAFVDLSHEEQLMVRPRSPGERFQPLGLGGKSTRVQDLMVDRHISHFLRDRWPIIATADHLVWLPGLHLDRRLKVTPDSKRIVELQCRRNRE